MNETEFAAKLKKASPPMKIKLLVELCEKFQHKDPVKCIKYGKLALQTAEAENDVSGIMTAHSFIGKGYLLQNKFEESIKWFKRVINRKGKSNETETLVSCYINIAIAYWRLDKIDKPMKFFQKALTYHIGKKDLRNVARDYFNIGSFLTATAKYSESIKKLEKAFQTFASLNDNSGMMKVLSSTADNYYYLGDIGKALADKLKSLSYFQNTNDLQIIARESDTISVLYKDIGDFEKAIEYSLKSLRIKEKSGNKFSIAFTLSHLGVYYKEWGNPDKALAYYQKALKIREELKSKQGISETLNNIGSILLDERRFKEALKYFRRALKIKNEIDDKNGKIIILQNLSSIYQKMEQIKDKAAGFLEEALNLSILIGNDNKTADISLQLSEIMITLGKLDKAEEYQKKTQDYLQENANDLMMKKNYQVCSKLYSAQKKYKKALACFQKYSELKDKIFSENKNKSIAEMQIKYETDKTEHEREVALSKAETLKQKNLELTTKNQIIEEQKNKLEETLDKLHKSEINYNFISAELDRNIKTTLVGKSEAIRNIIETISIVANSDKTNVLITGESGTGKEIVARNIHKSNMRKNMNFYAVNSSAIPENLFESQFFGHEKDAFTGAKSTKIGWFEIADKSTLFLDEIGTMSIDQQVKLLRVIEEQKFVRVGSYKEIKIDVRMITASNIDLLNLIEKKQFRADLYHRIATFVINIPPLRERKEDIPLLLRHFVKFFSSRLNKKINRIEPDVENLSLDYDYPGNVRELRNIIERAILISDSSTLKPKHFIIPQTTSDKQTKFVLRPLQEIEIEAVKKALILANFNQTKAAELLQIKRKAIERRILKYNLQEFLKKK